MLKLAFACVQFGQSLHCSRTCTKSAYIWHILSVNAQTRSSMHAVLSEPSLLSHMHMNGRRHGIFFQPMLRPEVACMQFCESLHCSCTCTKWAYIWHILSVNAQTRLCMCADSPEPSLLWHMHKMGIHMAYSFNEFSDES